MRTVASIRQLETMREEWNGLADLHAHALLRHEWFLSAAETLHRRDTLTVLVAGDPGRVNAIAPLVQPCGWGSALEIIGAAALHEPTALLATSADTRGALADALFGLKKPLALQRLSLTGDEVRALKRSATARRGLVVEKQTSGSLGVQLSGPGAAPSAQLPSKLRYDLKRAHKRAADYGEPRLQLLSPTPADVGRALDEFVRLEAAGWKGRERTALAAKPVLQAFFRCYTTRTAQTGTLRVFRLMIGDTLAAAQIAVQVYERLWVLKIAYNEALARCSPGLLLTAEALAYARRAGLRSYEFLGAPEAWEQRWQPECRPCTLFIFYPYTMRGCIAASRHSLTALLHRRRSRSSREH